MKTLTLLPLLALAACGFVETAPAPATPPPPPPPPIEVDWQDPTAETTWMMSLESKPVATYEDGLRAVALLVDRDLASQPWTTVKGRLMQRSVVPAEWNFLPDSPLTKGQLAYVLTQALAIDGGIMMNVLGPTRRYAFRECQQNGLVVGNYQQEAVSGKDLLASLYKAEVYQTDGNLDSLRRP